MNHQSKDVHVAQPGSTYPNLTIETVEQDVKYVQS